MLKRGSDSPALSLSLTPAFRHSDILRHNVENRGTRGSFSFSFFTPNDSQRLSPCRERVIYPPLVAVCRGRGGHSGAPLLFFFSAGFATSLNFFFVLSPQLFSSGARSPGLAEPFRGHQRVAAALQQRPRRSTPHRFSNASSSWNWPRFDAKHPLNVGVAAKSKFQQPRDRLSSLSYAPESGRKRGGLYLKITLRRVDEVVRIFQKTERGRTGERSEPKNSS